MIKEEPQIVTAFPSDNQISKIFPEQFVPLNLSDDKTLVCALKTPSSTSTNLATNKNLLTDRLDDEFIETSPEVIPTFHEYLELSPNPKKAISEIVKETLLDPKSSNDTKSNNEEFSEKSVKEMLIKIYTEQQHHRIGIYFFFVTHFYIFFIICIAAPYISARSIR